MTSLERVLTTLQHREPDRVPFFLTVTLHGARELGMSIREYFSSGENVAEGQVRLLQKYGHDCVYPLFYAALEYEAWGGEAIFYDDGPPNAGAPLIRKPHDILSLAPPRVQDSPGLGKVLTAIELLHAKVGGTVPIIAVIISPFSLPVLQMGFDAYLELLFENRELFTRLMEVNEEFAAEWANAQLSAGATAVAYFDPLSSPTMIPRETFLETGLQVARRMAARIKGATAIHLASGRSLGVLDDIAGTGAAVIGASVVEDLALVKRAARGKITVLGNLNTVEMIRWSAADAERAVKSALASAGPGGGFILADNHGEIPYQVSDETLHAISEAVRKWGTYPLDWAAEYAR